MNKEETPVEARLVLQNAIEGEEKLNKNDLTKYPSVVGKLLHATRWIGPDIYNFIQVFTRYLQEN